MHEEEVRIGLSIFREKLETGTNLKLDRFRRFSDRRAYHLAVALGSKQTDIVLTDEFLSDLPATKEYQAALDEYVGWLVNRMENVSPSEFYCKSGTPLKVEIYWPIESIANRAASFVHVYAYDIRFPGLVAKCSVIITFLANDILKRNPFRREEAIVNRIRRGVDEQEIAFFAEEAHPSELQQLDLEAEDVRSNGSSATDIEQFLAGKVYWLGFKQGRRESKTWITDPWDTEYLGVNPQALRQAAQILEARGIIVLDQEATFASAGKGLLLESDKFETLPPRPRAVLFLSADRESERVIRSVLEKILPSEVSLLAGTNLTPVGAIREDIRSMFQRADLLLFDITDNNPNIMYELGFAHALRKKAALLVSKNAPAEVPSNLSSFMYLPYERDNPEELTQALRSYLQRYIGFTRE